MRKHFLILMLMTLLPLAGFAQTASGKFRISTVGKNATIVGLVETVQASEVATLTIPEKLGKDADPEYYTVVGVGNFKDGATTTQKNGIQSIVIADKSCAGTGIAANAFEGLANLASVTIGDKVATIGEAAFKNCGKLTTVDLTSAAALTTVNKNAFQGTKVGSLDFTATKLSVAKNWFNNSNNTLATVKFPTTLTSIEAKAFMGCTVLATVEFNKSNTTANPQTIGESAFAGTAIANLNLANTNVVNIENMFGSFFNYPAILFTDGDETDPNSAVYYNAFETELGLPIDGTTAVSADKANAYYDAKGFMTVDANSAFTQTQCINYAHTAGISTITTGDVAATGEVLTAVNAACTAAELPTVTAGDAYTAIQVYAYVATLEGALKTTDKKIYANVLKYNAVMEATCIIPATAIIAAGNFATAIAYNATLDDAVTTADARVPARTATANNKLTTVTLPATWQNLGVVGENIPGAFENCKALTTVTFTAPVSDAQPQTINDKAFLGCPLTQGLNLTTTHVENIPEKMLRDGVNVNLNSKLATVVLPASLLTIEQNAFNSCIALSTVTLTACTKLKSIGNYAFGTTASLTSLDFTNCAKLLNFTNDGTATTDGSKDVTPFVSSDEKINTELTILKLHTNFNYIGTAFKNLKALTNDGNNIASTKIIKLSENALAGTDALTELTLPTQCATIAATGKTGLTKLVINNTNPTITSGAFAMAPAANSSVEFKNITGTGIAANAIVGALTTYATSLKIGAISANLANKIITNNVGAAETGAITKAVNTAIFGTATSLKVASIGTGGSLTGADAANNTLESLEISGTVVAGGIADGAFSKHSKLATINFKGLLAAGAVAAGAFSVDEDNYAGSAVEDLPQLVVNYAPASYTQAFDQQAFGEDVAYVTVVKLNTNRIFKLGQEALVNPADRPIYRVFISAPAATKDVDLARKSATSQFFYGKFVAEGNAKIAKENDGQKVMVYGAYVDESDATIYMEQLHVIGGYYYIPDGAPVIVKLTAAADNESQTATLTAVGDEEGVNNSLNYSDAALPVNEICYTTDEETVGLTLMNTTHDVDWTLVRDLNNNNYELYAMAKPEKYDLTWKKFSKTTSLPKHTFYVHCPKTVSASELKVVWLDGSEESNTTGIENVNVAKQFNGDIFNLQGQKVGADYKGVVIKNGKKIVLK